MRLFFLLALTSVSAFAQAPLVDPSVDPGGRVRWGVSANLGWHLPQSALTLGLEGRAGYQVGRVLSIYGVLGGFSVDIVQNHFRLDVNGGYFDRGNNPNFYPTDVVGPGECAATNSCKYPDYQVWTAGVSGQLSVWWGLPPSL